jgi:hypothetical protein
LEEFDPGAIGGGAGGSIALAVALYRSDPLAALGQGLGQGDPESFSGGALGEVAVAGIAALGKGSFDLAREDPLDLLGLGATAAGKAGPPQAEALVELPLTTTDVLPLGHEEAVSQLAAQRQGADVEIGAPVVPASAGQGEEFGDVAKPQLWILDPTPLLHLI